MVEKEIVEFTVRAKLLGVTEESINKIIDIYMNENVYMDLETQIEIAEAGTFEPWQWKEWENYNMLAISTIKELERELSL